jgi:hypothetical protein
VTPQERVVPGERVMSGEHAPVVARDEEHRLAGGNVGGAVRVGDTVRRAVEVGWRTKGAGS